MTTPAPLRPRTGRMRSEQARRAILDAALDLARRDPGALSVDAIAARAGVGKQTIYRWWPSKVAVLLDALLDQAALDVDIAPTGPVERDLTLFLRRAFHAITGPTGSGPVLRALMADVQGDPELAQRWRRQFIEPRRQALTALLTAAVDRGEIHEPDRDLVADLLFGAMWYRLLVGHAPLDDAFADRLAAAGSALCGSPVPRGTPQPKVNT